MLIGVTVENSSAMSVLPKKLPFLAFEVMIGAALGKPLPVIRSMVRRGLGLLA